MPEVWLSLKRSLQCKPTPSEVHDPNSSRQQRSAQRRESHKNSSSNIKDFTQGSKRQLEKTRSFSTKSRGSSDILNPITHEIIFDCSKGGFRICSCCPCPLTDRGGKGVEEPHRSTRPITPSRKTHHVECNESNVFSNQTVLVQTRSNDPSTLVCQKCGEKLKCIDAVEEHLTLKHSVIELHEEDSSRQIIETICRTSRMNSENKSVQIETVLKVQNLQKTFAWFEEYREMVKANADKLKKKQSRCLADGNELLRFHGTTLSCSLGTNGSSSLCTLDHCSVCQILRNGFFTKKEFHGAFGVFTTSTSGEAFESIGSSDERPFRRKSVIVCRVIAGRVHSPLEEEIQEVANLGVDSLAEKRSGNSEIEELYVLNPKAILPCFVVIYKP